MINFNSQGIFYVFYFNPFWSWCGELWWRGVGFTIHITNCFRLINDLNLHYFPFKDVGCLRLHIIKLSIRIKNGVDSVKTKKIRLRPWWGKRLSKLVRKWKSWELDEEIFSRVVLIREDIKKWGGGVKRKYLLPLE